MAGVRPQLAHIWLRIPKCNANSVEPEDVVPVEVPRYGPMNRSYRRLQRCLNEPVKVSSFKDPLLLRAIPMGARPAAQQTTRFLERPEISTTARSIQDTNWHVADYVLGIGI